MERSQVKGGIPALLYKLQEEANIFTGKHFSEEKEAWLYISLTSFLLLWVLLSLFFVQLISSTCFVLFPHEFFLTSSVFVRWFTGDECWGNSHRVASKVHYHPSTEFGPAGNVLHRRKEDGQRQVHITSITRIKMMHVASRIRALCLTANNQVGTKRLSHLHL